MFVLWAKSQPYHPLWKHMLDTAAVSLALPNPMEKEGWSAETTGWVVALHDVGKADACFQHQIPDREKDLNTAGFKQTGDAKCRHERISARFLKTCLEDAGVSEQSADTVQRAIVAHHGYWDECWRDVGEPYATAQRELCELVRNTLGVKDCSIPDLTNHSAAGMRLAGHIVLCDWIASNEEFFTDDRLKNCDDPKCYFDGVKKVAKDWVKKLQLERAEGVGKPSSIVSSARPIQQAILDNDIPPGLVIIEAPMGEGKTEAAWILAEKWRAKGYTGMYMALPTMATSDSLHSRYRDDYLKKLDRDEATHLVHGMAWLRDETEPEKLPETGERGDDRSPAAAWFRPTRRAMLAAHGVGTVDQAMLAGMHVKFGFLRLFGLTDRVLVIDEVHAYDAYMSAIICRLLQWCSCLDIPVILLSATLSAKQRAAMIEAYGATGGDPGAGAPYPLITVAERGRDANCIKADASSSRTLKLKTLAGLLGDAKETATKARELVKDGGCCCVILNTVKQAQAVYGQLKDQKLLFHARFTAADRERITNEVIQKFGKNTSNRPEKFILVATQVVEQSLDVDFDHMITEIAPMDLLLQRSGRLHRHRVREADPVLHVLTPAKDMKQKDGTDFGSSEKIYQRHPLLTTLSQLTAVNGDGGLTVSLPADFRRLIEATYSDSLPEGASDDLKDDLKEAKAKWDDLQENLAAQAGEFLLCEPMDDEFDPVGHDEVGDASDDGNGWRARTRLGLEDVLVIPLKPEEVEKWKKGELHPRLVKLLYKRSVKIPPYFWPPKALNQTQPVLGQGKLKGVWLLPVSKTEQGWEWKGLKSDNSDYTIKYDPTVGLTHGGEK
jgi:CRISPR-associated endonuclease/helicase Cas3